MDPDETQQKPKPTAKVEQIAGPSYLTGSNAKGTSNSDNDSSGSESNQPPLKKKMRLTMSTTQADKSVEINNDGATSDSNAIDTNTVSEYAPAEIALQNDLVLETLFRYMHRSDLLSCRIVNKQWQSEVTKELRRRKLVIRFAFQSQGSQMRRNIEFKEICRRLRQCKTPSLLSSFQVKTVGGNDLGSAGVRSFFSTIGDRIKHLTLHLNYWSKKCSFKSSSLTADLQNLLCRQAPNLEFLEIEFSFPHEWKYQMQALDLPDRPQNDNNEIQLLPNLKTFIVSGTPPPKFFANVINAAVNLRSMGGAWSACIKYLIGAEGRDKIHKLKSLQLSVHSQVRWNIHDLEVMEAFLTEHKQNLKLETFECVADFAAESVSFAARIVNVINGILECSSGSLQKVTIEPGKWYKKLLIIPRLPNVKEICFNCVCISRSGVIGDGFFPRGFNVNLNFPNISSIVLFRCSAFLFRRFVRRHRMGMIMTEPVPSIRYIILNDKGNKGDLVPPLATVTDFRHIFPNLVSISYVDSDKYYKI